MNTNNQKKPLVAIIGPTGSGKSCLAIKLAQKLNGEIINADSRQIYRYLNIGTAKPSSLYMQLVPHHLFDVIDPDADFSLAQYLKMAKKAITEIQQRGNLPFLVGGSGQYIWALIEGWEIPSITPDLEFRHNLEKIAKIYGSDLLYQKLLQTDPIAAKKIDSRNIRRVIRALEVSNQSQVPFSQQRLKKDPGYRNCLIGLTADRSELYRRTDERTDRMIHEGLIEEVVTLLQRNFSTNLPSMNSIGYKHISMSLQEEIDTAEALRLIKIDNHRFIRHQYAWFKLKDKRINWFNIQSEIEFEVMQLLSDFLTGN